MHLNTLFRKDSVELNSYLAKHPIGRTMVASDGSKTWTVKDVVFKTDLPPDPEMGDMVMVQVILESPDAPEATRSTIAPPI
jgi:hypothetical protein